MIVTKNLATGTVPYAEAHRLRDELKSQASALGATCSAVSVSVGEVTDTVDISFDVAPDDVALDAAIAAYPSIGAGVTGTFAVVAGSQYTLAEEPVGEGQSIVFDVHVHAAMGDASNFSATNADWYVIASRFTGGSVTVSQGSGNTEGNIPGFKIESVATATTAKIVITVRRDGQLTLMMNSVELISRGQVPA